MGARSRKTKEGPRNPKANASPLQDAPNPQQTGSTQPYDRQLDTDRRRIGHTVLAVEKNRSKSKHDMKTNDKNSPWERAAINTAPPIKSAVRFALPKSAAHSPLSLRPFFLVSFRQERVCAKLMTIPWMAQAVLKS